MPRRGTLRASDADRDQIVERLRKAAAEGRIAVHELEQRVTTALKARTYAELDATVRDLPAIASGRRARTARRATTTLRDHPALLLVAVPVALLVIATLVALTVVWCVITLALIILRQRSYGCWGPRSSARRRRFGPAHPIHGPRGTWM
jgi:Domain of unknown function (DUF1707)